MYQRKMNMLSMGVGEHKGIAASSLTTQYMHLQKCTGHGHRVECYINKHSVQVMHRIHKSCEGCVTCTQTINI